MIPIGKNNSKPHDRDFCKVALPAAPMTKETGSSATLWRARESDWRAAAEKALGDRDIDSLTARSDDGLAIGPIYRRRDDGGATIRRRDSGRPWAIVQRVDDPEPDRAMAALDADLAGGATGIELVLDGSASAARTGFGLRELHPELIAILSDRRGLQVRLDAGPASYDHYRLLRSQALETLILSFDPLAEAAARGGFSRALDDIEDDLLRTARDFRDSGSAGCAVVADGRVWAAGGASEAQEIAGILGSTTHSLRALINGGLTPRQALDAIGLVVDVGAHQPLAIAKLRAVRLCHARIVEAFDLPPMRVRLHAETSWRMMTRYDVYTNILRSTSAASAAGIAGADSVTVLPCTIAVGLPDAFARRVARNAQAILVEESGLARVDDPGAGSGAVESLTEALAEAAWTEFRKLEAAGGLATALRSGDFQADIGNTRRTRTEKIAHRQIAITGVSRFPATGRTDTRGVADCLPAPKSPPANVEPIPPINAVRFAEPFEALRDRAAERADAGKPPRIFLANLGAAAEFSEAAQSAANLFAAGGITVVDVGGFDAPADAARAFSASGTSIACIAGGRDALRRHAAATAQALKEARAARVYVFGAGEAAGAIDAALDDTVDVIAILDEVLTLSGA
jgi:methylmalonyl-CoA mutase